MAPIFATATGITPQVVDDADLRELLHQLQGLTILKKTDTTKVADETMKQLIVLLEPWKREWLFEEQVDLYAWIHPLNVMDAILTWILNNYSQNLLLLPPFLYQNEESTEPKAATSLEQVNQCPAHILEICATMLQFQSVLLRNCTNKQLYASVPTVADFLAAADDNIADVALSVLSALSLPPALHKQQAPEHQAHHTQLHQASSRRHNVGGSDTSYAATNTNRTDVHDRLMATARGWGTRSMGLGLFTMVTADDSVNGQGLLPEAIGEVNFCYYNNKMNGFSDGSALCEVTLSLEEMLGDSRSTDGALSSPESSSIDMEVSEEEQFASKKRRKVNKTPGKRNVKTTAELFFLATEKTEGIQDIPTERLFSLLADIRLARCYDSQVSRRIAVGRRLQALIAILHAHPSQDMMSGYSQAQPELCVEIVDLLRPLVSAANVSAASVAPVLSAYGNGTDTRSRIWQDSISNLVGSSTQIVPYELRMLAIEALTALVTRRDGSTGQIPGASSLTSVLAELGVSKGQYLGILPTLIRYSLASLRSVVVTHDSEAVDWPFGDSDVLLENPNSGDAFGIGLVFVNATMPTPLPRQDQVERALQFIDNVLTLTSAVVGTPSGTSALVDCGLIPALLTTVSLDPDRLQLGLLPHTQCVDLRSAQRVKAWLRFIAAQAVQILEGAIVTHSNALTTFHDLQGVDALTSRLSKELTITSKPSVSLASASVDRMDCCEDVEMDNGHDTNRTLPRILSSQRVLLFSIFTCLTVVFHQESTATNAATPTGGSQLRKQELTDSLVTILDDVSAYGGHLASLIATLLSDVMNNDPHVVSYVHKSGIAQSFLKMVIGNKAIDAFGVETVEPLVPPVPELIMAIPNVIDALALTEDGAKALAELNPFPSLLRLFHHPLYAMPRSRCLLNEMTSIVGTGLEEVMRHVVQLKPFVMKAVVDAMQQVANDAENLAAKENQVIHIVGLPSAAQKSDIENERTCVIQYVLNFGQLLEQILHTEENCEPFVNTGGLDALVRLFAASIPTCNQFLTYASCLSSPSVTTMHHATTEEALCLVTKCLDFRYDTLKLLRKYFEVVSRSLDELEESQRVLFGADVWSLNVIPPQPLQKILGSDSQNSLRDISNYLRNVVNVQWATTLLANTIKAAHQRGSETGTGWSLAEREWKSELSSAAFQKLLNRLSVFHRASLLEVCRVRTEDCFERQERERLATRTRRLRFRLRIVCPEGAVVRDGIEIDSCANVGSLEMGDIVDAFDRCINSSGILRYRTKRGWISEMTRGHGREPIAEVINIWECENECLQATGHNTSKKRMEAGAPGLRSVATSVLARGQSGYSELFNAFSRVAVHGVRTLQVKPFSFDDGAAGSHIATMINILASDVMDGLNQAYVAKVANAFLGGSSLEERQISDAGAAMYIGCIIHHLHLSLFEEKRERRLVNFPLLLKLVASDNFVAEALQCSKQTGKDSSKIEIDSPPTEKFSDALGIFNAMRFVFKRGLSDFALRELPFMDSEKEQKKSSSLQRVGRSVAASLPPLILMLRRLMTSQMATSPSASIMSRIKVNEVQKLIGDAGINIRFASDDKEDSFFHPENFAADLQFALSRVVYELWTDARLLHAPPFLVHPVANLVADIMAGLEIVSKTKTTRWSVSSGDRQTERMRLSELLRRRHDQDNSEAADGDQDAEFEVSEDSIVRLMEMGFSRDHALDALESIHTNQVETAMDILLSNPPPSPETIERRRTAREERSRSRAERQRISSSGARGDADVGIESVPVETGPGTNLDSSPFSSILADDVAMDFDQSHINESSEKAICVSYQSWDRKAMAKAELASWLKAIPEISCNLLAHIPPPPSLNSFNGTSTSRRIDGDAEIEALTVVLCTFMLNSCHRFPDERFHFVSLVLTTLKEQLLTKTKNDETHYFIASEREASASALCHAAVLILRALPKTRLLLLKEGLVGALVSCIQLHLANDASENYFPIWLSPSLLLLDIMAQPGFAFSDVNMVKSIRENSPDSEFFVVQKEHNEQASNLLKMAERCFATRLDPESKKRTGPNEVSGRGMDIDTKSTTGKAKVDPNDLSGSCMDVDEEPAEPCEKESSSPFAIVPAFFPLLPQNASRHCVEICQCLLDSTNKELALPPGVAQSCLSLLLRLIRTPCVSSECLQNGVAESVLNLPKNCAFIGNSGLVTLIFRRLLEDETTLQSSMETEIRGIFTKLHSSKILSKDSNVSIPVPLIMDEVTPLMCREPACFLRAMSLSLALEPRKEMSDTTTFSLLSPEERKQRVEHFASLKPTTASQTELVRKGDSIRMKRLSIGSKFKGKTFGKSLAKRFSFSKKGRKEKGDTLAIASHTVHETPASHIAYLLIHRIMTAPAPDALAEDECFLWSGDMLEILADLVLAVPAFASAVHNYRFNKPKDKLRKYSWQANHALGHCPPPPKTFVTFLLHCLLPQDRWTMRNDPDLWDRHSDGSSDESEIVESKKRKAYGVMKIAQSAARVVLSLSVRPGEGRRRVIADLVFALSGGRLGHGSGSVLDAEGTESSDEINIPRELHALNAWGELCLGIAAPRGNGKNMENLSFLSVDNIRIMLEYGIAHSLLFALQRVRLNHPMASSACGILLLPLEILTRANVTDAVKTLCDKDAKSSKFENVEDADNHTGAVAAPTAIVDPGTNSEGAHLREGDHDMEDEASHLDDEEMEEVGGSEDEDDIASNEESEEEDTDENSEDEEIDDDSDDDDNDEGSQVEDSDDDSSLEVDEEGDWDVDFNSGIAADGQGRMEEDDDDDDGTERIEADDDGWTRIESNGVGSILLDGRRGIASAGNDDNPLARSRGFINAAEAMIGSLLRSGDINGETLSEIENTLGIRIMPGGRSLRNSSRPGENDGSVLDPFAALRVARSEARHPDRRSEGIGTLPHIFQRSQPDVGSSAFGRSGQSSEICSMEFVYGGPSITGGSRNYDIVTPLESEPTSENPPPFAQLDYQLFQGGPAAAASARTQHSLHPLLCGVDLPPVNSLVSDLIPHGVRARRRGQTTTRRPSDWSGTSLLPGDYLVSTSSGSIVRSHRAHTGAMQGSSFRRNSSGSAIGLIDDALPVDATVVEFRSAFEVALDATARVLASADTRNNDDTTLQASGDSIGADATNSDENAGGTAFFNEGNDNAEQVENTVNAENETSRCEQNGHEARNEGDQVASSLADSLRLSHSEADGIAGEDFHLSPSRGEQSDSHDNGMSGTFVVNREQSHTNEDAVMNDASSLVDIVHGGSNDNQDNTEAQGAAATNVHKPLVESNMVDTDSTLEILGSVPVEGVLSSGEARCPPDIDEEVFNSLPREMQQDCIDQYIATQELASQLDGSSLDPEALAALPEELRREVIEQDRQERLARQRQEVPADPALAEEMDNASFIASLTPQLREDILLTADETFLASLPPSIVAEAQVLRDRASVHRQRLVDGAFFGLHDHDAAQNVQNLSQGVSAEAVGLRRRQRSGKLRVERERPEIVFLPESLSSPISKSDLKQLIRLMYLLSPVRPQKLLQKVFSNICTNPILRSVVIATFVKLLHEDGKGALAAIESLQQHYSESDSWRKVMDALFSNDAEFPPAMLLGAAPDVPNSDGFCMSISSSLLRRRQGLGTAASLAANLPKSSGGASNFSSIPPVVAARVIDTILHMCKTSPRFCIHTLVSPVLEAGSVDDRTTSFEAYLDLLNKPMFFKSVGNLEQLLNLLEAAVSLLSHVSPYSDEDAEISQRDVDAAALQGKEWIDVPCVAVSQSRLQLLCSILRMETCRDAAFTRVNTIIRRLCRVERNRGFVLAELASVAHGLGADAIVDLKALRIRMDIAVSKHQLQGTQPLTSDVSPSNEAKTSKLNTGLGSISSSITLSTGTSELKLLRVLQTLQSLCNDNTDENGIKKTEGSVIVTEELVILLRQMQFDDLWDELSACLNVVQVLEGVRTFKQEEEKASEFMETENNDEGSGEGEAAGKATKLRNNAAGLLTRFLPSIEAFFVANASATRTTVNGSSSSIDEGRSVIENISFDSLVGGKRLMTFVNSHKVLLNALIRNNPALLDKGLRALVQISRCRGLLDFDVKRQWFKTQMRRLRQQANRRHGSLRLHVRRKHVFEDAYQQLLPRRSDELRGRLHITFRNEEGVDAGGLSREFFGILAKEMFNPNYALFTSTEDGCTFQPNPYSAINPDHLAYFRFVGRVVGKAVADGFLLDAHFTRSLYKHMLGVKPTHHDMEAIDPDYYRNLKSILEHKLADIGLELTFSIEDHSFGRTRVVDLMENGRNNAVTEGNKKEYVQKVCQHRMTTAIKNQIKSFLDGFYDLVNPELIAVFTPRELELLISGLPDIDVHDLKANTDYVGWKATDKEIGWFWKILLSLSRNEMAAFVQFVTGSSKVPLAGFAELQGMRGIQKFSIHKAGGSSGALMSAHTCFNSLDLPVYHSEEEMRSKLLLAINEGGGAFLFA